MKGSVVVACTFVLTLLLASWATRVGASDDPAVSVTITAYDDVMSCTDWYAGFRVTTTSTSAVHVDLSVSGLPSGWTYLFSPDSFDLAAGSSQESTLQIYGTQSTSPGTYQFVVTATYPTGQYTLIQGPLGGLVPDTGEYVQSTDDLNVLSLLVIPEYPLGTILALVMCLVAAGLLKSGPIQVNL